MCGFDQTLQKVCIVWKKDTHVWFLPHTWYVWFLSHTWLILHIWSVKFPLILFLVWKPAKWFKFKRFCQYCDHNAKEQ